MRCNAYDNTKNHLLSYRIKLDNKEFFPGLIERNGEILLSKSNIQDLKYITRRFQEHAFSKYGLPMSEKMFNIYDAKKPLNKGYTALSIRKGSFILLEQHIDNFEKSQKDSKEYTPDTQLERDINYFNQDRALLEQEDREIRGLRKEIDQLESNYSPQVTSNNSNWEGENFSSRGGVNEVFNSVPELSKIGTQQEYSKYLDTIFPDSKVKDIVYHGTLDKIESFDKSKIGKNTIKDRPKGFYFTRKNVAENIYGSYPIIDNSTGEQILQKGNLISAIINTKGQYELVQEKDDISGYGDFVEYPSHVVFEPEQIHILGSKQDIEGFKKYVVRNTDNYSPNIIIPSSIPNTNPEVDSYKNAYAEYFNYKNSILNQTKRYLYETNVEIKKTKDPVKKSELIQTQQELKEAIYGNEVKGIVGLAKQMSDVNKDNKIYKDLLDIRTKLEKSLETLQVNGLDTTQVLSQLQDNALKLYNLKNESLGELLRANSLQDLDRASNLIKTNKLSNLVKAKEIINFYKSVDPNNQELTNPYYSKEELLSGKINPSIIENLHDIANKAYNLENSINNTSRKSILDYINSLDTFLNKNNNELYTEEDIFKDKEGLLDITLLDQVVYNIQDNPFSKVDSILQAAIFKKVKDSISQEEAAIKDITDELDDRNPKVVKELLRLGHRLSDNSTLSGIRHRVLGRLDNTPDFSIFKQISNEGVLRNKLVQRESDKYKSKVKAIKAQFNKDISALLNGTNTSKTSEDINNLYYNKLREVSEIVKPHLMPEIISIPEYADLLDNNTTVEVSDIYKNSIIEKIGLQGYNDILEKQKRQLDSYIIAKKQKEDTLIYMYAVENDIEDPSTLTLANLDEEKQVNLIDWTIDHSPFYNGLLFDNNQKVRTRDRRYNNYELDYNEFIPRSKEARIVYQRNYPDNVSKNFRLITAVESNVDTGFLDERYKTIEDNPILYDFWKTSMKASEYYQQSLSLDERQTWEEGDLPIDDKVSIDRFTESSDSVKDKMLTYISKNFRNILKNIYTQLSSTMDLPYSKYDYTDKKLDVNTSAINVGTRSINNEIRLREIELKKILKDNGFQYKDVIAVQNIPSQFIREALFLYGTNNTKLSQMSDSELQREFISSFNLEPNRRNIYSANILSILKDLHTQNALKQTNGDLGLTLLKSASLASGIIARKKNTDMVQFMVDAFNTIKLTDTNSYSTPKVNNKTGSTVILANMRKKAVSQMTSFIKNQFELRGSGNDNNLIANKEEAENLKHGFFNNYVLDNQKDLELIDELLEDPNITPKEQEDLLRIKLQKIRYFDGIKGVLRPISTQLRLVSLGYKTISNITNLYEGTKQILIHDAKGEDWIPGKGTEALAIMKGAFVRNLTQFNKKLDKSITPQASKARFIIDRLDFIEDASTLEAKALKKQSTTGVVKDIASGLSPYVLIKKIEYVNQGSVALAMLMSQPITDSSGNISNVWDALDNKGELKPEFKNEDNINSWEKFNSQEALDFKAKLNNARNKTSGDYSQLGESQLNTSAIGKLVLNFKKWMPKYIAQMYGNYRYDYDTGKNIKGRAKSLHPAELILHRISSSLALKGFGVHALFLAPMIAADFYSHAHDLDPNKPQLKDMVGRLGLMTKVALKTVAGLPINFLASGIYKNKPIINTSNDKLFGKSLESKLLNQGISPEDIGNIKAMGVELGMNIINVIGIMLVYGTLLSGDDDDEETPKTLGYTKNEWGTIVQNTLMPLLKQGEAFYADPLNAFTTINNIPIVTYIEQLDKSATSLNRVINGLDTDYIARGRDAGKYKSDKIIKKVVPVPMRDMDSKKYMRFEEYIPGQLLQDPGELLNKKIGNLRSEIKNNLKNEITKDNLEEMYNKYEIEYKPEDKEGESIPYTKLKTTLLEKIMRSNLPKPSKGDKKEAYEALQKVRDGEMDYTDYLDTYVISKEEKEELEEE